MVVDRLVHLPGGLKGDVLLRSVQRSDRGRGVGARDRGANVFERQPARRGGLRIGLDADGEFLRAVDIDLGYTWNL